MSFNVPRLEGRYTAVFRILAAILFLNLGVAAAKLIYGWISHSGSMFADGIHSFSDGASNIVGMIGIWMASRPPDEDHPYGHKKHETFGALAISAFLLVICVFLIREAILRFRSPHMPEVTVASFVVMSVTILVNAGVTWYERKRGRELESDVLLSDALHTQADLLTSLSVIVSLVCVRLGFPLADPIATVFIAFFVGWAAFRIIRASSDVLLDHVVLDVTEIERLVRSVPKIRGCHEIRTRGRRDDVHVDLHILVDNKMPIEEAHELASHIEEKIKRDIRGVTDVIVHIEPSSHHHPPGSPDKN